MRDADESTPAGRRISLCSPTLQFDRGYRVLMAVRRLLVLIEQLEPDALEVNDWLLVARVSAWARSRRVPVVQFAHERLDAALRDRLTR